MKIFNWMHRRFHRKGDHEVGDEAKKMELVKYEHDKVALLENRKLANYVLDGWADGILTIGTLGFDPLEDLNKQVNEYYNYADAYEIEEAYCDEYCKDEIIVEDEEEAKDDKKVGEMDPLMLGAFQHGYEHHDGSRGGEVDEVAKPIYDDGDKIVRDDAAEVDQKNKSTGKRITLADLFSAENDMEKKASGGKGGATKVIGVGYLKKAASANVIAKHGSSLSKKIISGVKQDSRPMKKLQKLMTKMLRKKIHPDIEAKVQKEEEAEATNDAQVVNAAGNGVAESVSLLQTRVAVG